MLADRYRIERELGAGGMATVFLAHDIKHDRDVAIKVLHPDLAAALGGDRFLSEIKTTARLQHPHILPLLDSGGSDGLLFYVMPYVRGETLRDRLARETQLPVHDALRIANEVADALAAAHEAGIIHRDIKPENILLQGDHALVADFGIALAVQQAGGARMTQTGLSLGTPQYMAPEQAMGDKTIDQRVDVYALAAVTYEMLTGEPPHTGANAQAIVAKLLTEKVRPAGILRPTVPAHVDAALQVALQKIPADRFDSIREFADALRGGTNARMLASSVAAATPAATRTNRRRQLPLIGLNVVLALGVAALAFKPKPELAMLRQRVVLWRTPMLNPLIPGAPLVATQAVITPDGESIIYADSIDGWMLWRKTRTATDAEPIAGTERGVSPVLSPDGKWLAFATTDGRIKKMPASGGSAVTIAEDGRAEYKALSFLDDGSFVYLSSTRGPVHIPPPGGGAAKSLKDPSDGSGSFPSMWGLPGSKGVLFSACRGNCAFSSDVFVYDFAADSARMIIANAVGAWYMPSGHILYTSREGGVFAVAFNLRKLAVEGDPIPVLDGVQPGQFTISASGAALYTVGSSVSSPSELVWVDRSGRESSLDTTWKARFEYPAISPDGRIAVSITERTTDLWITKADGTRRKVNAPVDGAWRPAWFAGGRALTFIGFKNQANNGNDVTVWRVDADASAPAQQVFKHKYGVYEAEIAPDSTLMVFRADEGPEGGNIYARHLHGDTAFIVISNSKSNDLQPTLSPDGRKLAYTTDESGAQQVYVASFPDMKVKRLVSRGGGREPRWSRSGKELFFVSEGRLMSVNVGDQTDLSISEPKALFAVGGYRRARNRPQYDIAPGDQKFLMIKEPPRPAVPPVVYVENWLPELRAKLKK